jgi:hypothetical protein
MPGQAGPLYGTLGAACGPLGAWIGADRREDTQLLLATGEPLQAKGAVGPGQVVVDEAHVCTPEVVVALQGAIKQKADGPVAVPAWAADLLQASAVSGGQSSVRPTDLCTDVHLRAA